MNFNIDFDLKKAKSLLLSEGYQDQGFESEDEMQDYYNDSNFINEDEEYRMGIFDDIDADLMDEEDRMGYLDAVIKYCTKQMEDLGNDTDFIDEGESLDENNSPEYMKGYGDGYTDGYYAGKQGIEPEVEINEGTLDEMAKIAGDLKSSIESVITANPDLQGLSLKKAIKGDAAVINALDGEDLYDNQLNKFIALVKGEREVGQRGRKADPNKPAAEPKVRAEKPAKEKSPKLKITNPTADEKPVAASFIDGEDEEEMAAEKQAIAAAKGNKRLGTAAEKLAQVTKEMKALIPAYQAAKGTDKEAAIVAQLRDLTAEKKSLEAKVFKAPKSLSAADLMGGEEA